MKTIEEHVLKALENKRQDIQAQERQIAQLQDELAEWKEELARWEKQAASALLPHQESYQPVSYEKLQDVIARHKYRLQSESDIADIKAAAALLPHSHV